MPALPINMSQNIGTQLSYGFIPSVLPANTPNAVREINVGPVDNNTIGWTFQTEDKTTHENFSNFETDSIRAQIEFPCQAIQVPEEDIPIYSSLGFQTISIGCVPLRSYLVLTFAVTRFFSALIFPVSDYN